MRLRFLLCEDKVHPKPNALVGVVGHEQGSGSGTSTSGDVLALSGISVGLGVEERRGNRLILFGKYPGKYPGKYLS